VLVVYCHPNETSFASTLHQTVLKALRSGGHEVTDLDLYADGFRPVMSREERREYEDPAQYRAAIKKYALQLAETEAIVAVYPTWWYGLPAMLKGYFDRVWAPGIAFDMGADGAIQTERLDNIPRARVPPSDSSDERHQNRPYSDRKRKRPAVVPASQLHV
jgi:NAD(P)H dehydrogenase (quinone)